MSIPAKRRDNTPNFSGSGEKYKISQATRAVRWWHEAIIDDMLAHPMDDVKVRAKRLGYVAGSLSGIMNSDMFKLAYEERANAFRARLENVIAQKTMGVASVALDIMKESLELKRTAIPFRDLAAATDGLLSKLGYGAVAGAGVQVNVNAPSQQTNVAIPATKEQLAQARELIRGVEQQNALATPQRPALTTQATDSEAIDVTPTSSK